MGTIAEKFSDEKGLIWPESVAPFKYYLIGIGEAGTKLAEEIYDKRDDVLFDDRDVRPGEKFGDADLIGIPYRIVISDKTLEEGAIEITNRANGETKLVKIEEIEKSL